VAENFKPLNKNRPSMQTPATGALPPAGHQRDEELKRRTDALEAKAAETHAEVQTINPDVMDVERELAGHFNSLDITNKDARYVYKWVNFVSNGGIMLRQAVAPPERWEVVTGDAKEAAELRQVDGTRKLGDVMLVRMPKERYAILEKVQAQKAARQHEGLEANIREVAAKRGKGKIRVYNNDDMPENVRRAIEHPSPGAVDAMRGAMAAQDKFDSALRDGSLAV
jgi:hypothetical protein